MQDKHASVRKKVPTLTPSARAVIKADAPVHRLRACHDIRITSGPAARPPTALASLRGGGRVTKARSVCGWRPGRDVEAVELLHPLLHFVRSYKQGSFA